MPRDPSAPPLVDALKASASKLKETKSALETRARELDALKAQLDAQRDDLEKQAEEITTDRSELEKERAAVQKARAALDRDLEGVQDARARLESQERRLRDGEKALEARARAIREDEARIEQLGKAFGDRLAESEAKLQALVEREGELVKMRNDWLASFEAGGKSLLTITEDMNARQQEATQQHASLVELQTSLRDELSQLVAEREKLQAKEKSLLEAQSYLAAALESAGIAPPEEPVATYETSQEPPTEEAPAQEPSGVPPDPAEAPPAVAVEVHEEPLEPVVKRKVTRAEALNRLTKAVETWKRARDAGQDVAELRKTLLHARAVLDAGDFEAAHRIANETLERLQAVPLAR
jgi:chromosome segregation ATPase